MGPRALTRRRARENPSSRSRLFMRSSSRMHAFTSSRCPALVFLIGRRSASLSLSLSPSLARAWAPSEIAEFPKRRRGDA
jgi:hypothetical protein